MFDLDYKFKFFACFYLFMTTKMKNVVSQIYLQSEKKNKNLGDIKCVEVKRVFCIKHEKKTLIKIEK